MLKFYFHYALGEIDTLFSDPSGERDRCQRFTADQWKSVMHALTSLSIQCADSGMTESIEAFLKTNQGGVFQMAGIAHIL